MSVPFLDLTRQARRLAPHLRRAAERVLASGAYILGPEVDRFEEEFARRCRTRFAVGVASGTDALELALRALGIGRGDRVATVSWTFIATADAILHVGATPLFIDIEPESYTMDPVDLERKVRGLSPIQRRRLKAVISVHIYGHPCNMEAIGRMARRYRLAVIEDAAQAAGASWKGRPVGGLGRIGCFSFFPTKTLGGFGDGGMAVTSSKGLADRLRILRVHGRGGGRQGVLGRNSRLDALQAALLRVKLPHLDRFISRRRALAHRYTQALSRIPQIVCPAVHPKAGHVFALYVIRAKDRDRLKEFLRGQGIVTQAYYEAPVHHQRLHRGGPPLRETDAAARSCLALPLFPEFQPTEQAKVIRAIRLFYQGRPAPIRRSGRRW